MKCKTNKETEIGFKVLLFMVLFNHIFMLIQTQTFNKIVKLRSYKKNTRKIN